MTKIAIYESAPRTGGRRMITVPIAREGLSPDLHVGEFAVVDTTNIEPQQDGLFFVKGANPGSTYSALVRLKPWPIKSGRVTNSDGTPDRGPFWMTCFGRSRVYGSPEARKGWADDGYAQSGDGPMDDELMRRMIVGRVVGVVRPLP